MEYSILPLRNTVLFPNQIIPIYIGREQSLKLINDINDADNKDIVVVAQKDGSVELPADKDLYLVGTLATVMKIFDMPDNSKSAIVKGIKRVKINKFTFHDPYFKATIVDLNEIKSVSEDMEALCKSLKDLFTNLIEIAPYLSEEQTNILINIQDPSQIADKAISVMNIPTKEKQQILEEIDITKKIKDTLTIINREIQRLELGDKIQADVQGEISKSQKEYYLREQMRAIKKELGDEDSNLEIDEIREKIKKAKMPKEVLKVAEKEVKRLQKIPSHSPEYTVTRTYLDWLIELPWSKQSKDNENIKRASKILDSGHYGLAKIKERIIEHLAVRNLKKSRSKKGALIKSPILCFIGPPGTGKTSIGKDIAKSMGREFVRISLGGVRDEAEIRGHRRTYIGSLPGKIIQLMKKAGTKNPLILLDEIDKVGNDYRGDPSSALLEALDPEQNTTFNDHYLEVDYDLSDVMFVTTANTLNILPPLLDRMEVIRIPGYTEDEKINIANKYLLPKQVKNNGVKDNELDLKDGTIKEIIRSYTREAGVRNLEREISKITRKVVKKIVNCEETKVVLNADNINDFLGVKKFKYGEVESENKIGIVTGLAWTEFGGEILKIETVNMPGKGRMQITGKLGDVMQESVKAAKSFVRSKSLEYGILPPIFEKKDFHIHVPEGATPKDGPSFGVAPSGT